MAEHLKGLAETPSGTCDICGAGWVAFIACERTDCRFQKRAAPSTGWKRELPVERVPDVTVAVAEGGWKSEIVVSDTAWRTKG